MRRRLHVLLILICISLFLQNTVALTPEDYDPSVPEQLEVDELYSYASVLIDADSGTVLFSKNAEERVHPASTTKIMTLLLGIERGISLDREIAIPQAAADVPGDSTLIPVYPGDIMTYGDLLTAFSLASGNDGANAIAVIAAGSIDAFVAQMNARAEEIGCTGTHFSNPHGYTDGDHYTTAYDLALITRVAMQNETFRSIVRKTGAAVRISGNEKTVSSQHMIMKPSSGFYYADCIGVKTGTTSDAGKCYVGAAERNGATLISVVMKCETDDARWIDTARLFDYGWTRYEAVTFDRIYRAAADRMATCIISNAKTDNGSDGRLELDIAQISNMDFRQMIVKDNPDDFNALVEELVSHSTVQITHALTAPIFKGEIMGDLLYVDPETGEKITAKLVAGQDIEEKPALFALTDLFPFLKMLENRTFKLLLIVLAILLILIVLLVLSRRAAKERRRREILERKRREQARRRRQAVRYSVRNTPSNRTSGRSGYDSQRRPR